MEKRRFERVADSLDAKIVMGESVYSGIIMNFSEKGLHMVTATLFNVVEITPSTILGLKCRLPSGESVEMKCEVKWFRQKPSPFGVSFSIGMEIQDPPLKYREFIKARH